MKTVKLKRQEKLLSKCNNLRVMQMKYNNYNEKNYERYMIYYNGNFRQFFLITFW